MCNNVLYLAEYEAKYILFSDVCISHVFLFTYITHFCHYNVKKKKVMAMTFVMYTMCTHTVMYTHMYTNFFLSLPRQEIKYT